MNVHHMWIRQALFDEVKNVWKDSSKVLVLYLSMFIIVLVFIRAPFYVLLVFIVCVVCLLVVLVKLSLLAKLLARKTP